MNLDTAMNEFDKTNEQVNGLIVKREKLKNLILDLQYKVRTDTGKGVFRMDSDASKIKVGGVSRDMELEAARTSLGSISDSISRSKIHQVELKNSLLDLEKRHSETLALIEELKHKKIINPHHNDDLRPREKLRLDMEDMWKNDHSDNDIEREDKNDMSPRDQLNNKLSEMWK